MGKKYFPQVKVSIFPFVCHLMKNCFSAIVAEAGGWQKINFPTAEEKSK